LERHIPPLSKAKWSADTERAFLLALRLTGQAKAAALEIGRTSGAVYARRAHNPGFKRDWDAVVAAQQDGWIAAQQARLAESGAPLADGEGQRAPWREVRGGFGTRKRAHFLRVLRRTKHVEEACREAGVATSTAYALRSRAPRFAAAWEKALTDTPPPSVIAAALQRAVEGWQEPIVRGGQVVAQRWRFSEGLLRDLLRAEIGKGAGGGAAGGGRWAKPDPKLRATEAELNEAILTKLGYLGDRLKRKTAEDWDRWRLSWIDPVAARRPEEPDDDEDWDED